MKRLFFLLLIGAGITACSFHSYTRVSGAAIPVTGTNEVSNRIDSLVAPYRSELEQEMNLVIGTAEEALTNERPSGTLGNWVCDALLAAYRDTFDVQPLFCLLNFGGLRSPINAGAITVGDIFKVMPFDNQVVLVHMPTASMEEIIAFLRKTSGEPIGGFQVKNGRVYVNNAPWVPRDFWILTSDFLVNGGDKMTFFSQRLQTIETGELLRDKLLTSVRQTKTIHGKRDERITW